MIEKHLLSDQCTISCLKTAYGLEVSMLAPLSLGADVNAFVYKAQAIDLTSYFIKIKHGHNHHIGVEVAALLQGAGITQIISPIRTIHHTLTQRMGDFTLIVYPFVEGKNGFDRELTDNQWIALGNTLRKIHEITPSLFLPVFQNKLCFPL